MISQRLTAEGTPSFDSPYSYTSGVRPPPAKPLNYDDFW